MADLFGDASLFAEFEKDREADGSFIRYDENSVKSRIIFEGLESEEEPESEDDWVPEISEPKWHKKSNGVVVPAEEDNEKDKDESESEKVEEDKEKETTSEEVKEGEDKSESKDDDVAKEETEQMDTEEEGAPNPVEETKEEEKVASKPVEETKKPEVPTLPTVSIVPTPKKKEKPEEKIDLLDDEDTAWLYEHLYDPKVSTSTSTKPNVQQLKYERNKYHRFCKMLDSTRYVPDDDSPAVQLLFNNNTFARKYRQQIEQFIKGLLWTEFNSNNTDTTSEIETRSSAPSCVDINDKLGPEQKNERMRQRHVLLGNCQFHKQFLIDFLGWPFTTGEPLRCNINWEIPLYGQIFDEVYADPSSKPKKPTKKAKPACWNCGHENHSVVDCRMPRNQARIASNRKEFMEQMQEQQQNRTAPKFTGASRYHLDPDIASKYAKFRPGNLSEKLREALGLTNEQLPQHVYKMRLFGYPPGWLTKAKQVESGVAIFDKDGRVSKQEENGMLSFDSTLTMGSGDKVEEGEYVQEKNEYDVSKIIEFPGFTIPTPEGFVDDHESFKMPPIQDHQLKKTLQQQSEEKAASRKRKRAEKAMYKEEEEAGGKKAKTEAIEGEGEDSPLVDGEKAEIKEEAADKSEDSEEATKSKEATEKDTDADSNATEPCEDVKMEDVTEEAGTDKPEADKPETDMDEKDDDAMQPPATPTASAPPSTPKASKPPPTPTSASTISLRKDYGTPILTRQKHALPDSSKFGMGVEDHIPFENLPDSVGTFNKMRNIIDVIRQKNKK